MFGKQYITELITNRNYDTIAIFTAASVTANQIDFATGTKTEMLQCWDLFTDNCATGTYSIHLYIDKEQVGGGSKSDHSRRRKIPYRHAGEVAANTMYNDGMNNPMFNQLLELHTRLNEERMERKIDQMKTENSNQGVEMITELVKIMGMKKGSTSTSSIATPALNLGHNEVTNDPQEEKEYLAAFEKWQQLDSNWLSKLKGLVDLAESDPDTYKMASEFIIKDG